MAIISRGKSTIHGLEDDLSTINQKLRTLESEVEEELPVNDKLYVKVNNEWTETGDTKDPVTGTIVTDLGTY